MDSKTDRDDDLDDDLGDDDRDDPLLRLLAAAPPVPLGEAELLRELVATGRRAQARSEAAHVEALAAQVTELPPVAVDLRELLRAARARSGR